MFRSIKGRLTVTICAILLLVFLVQMAVNFLFAGEFYMYQKINTLKDAYSELSRDFKESDETIQTVMQGLEVDRNLEFFIADENLNLIYTNDRFAMMNIGPVDPRIKPPVNFEFERYPRDYYQSTDPTVLKTDMMDGDRIRLLGKLEKGDTAYYVAIRLSVQSYSREMKNTNLFLLYITAFGIIAGGISVYFISRRFTKPIEEINRVAIQVSKLDFSARAKAGKRKDEIASLATNINRMSECLEENIDHLREANRKLEIDNEYMNRVDEQRKELIANISHELKTPLAILSGYSEMLQNDIPGIDKDFYYETIKDETRKMNILIQNLLNLSDMENKLTLLSPEEIDPVEFTDRIFRKYGILFNSHGIRSDFQSKDCGRISADPLYLEEAINNYLSNAISHTKKGHRIRITVEPKDGEAVITVFNEGENIEEAQIDKIWNSFYRIDRSRTRTPQNNIGLGLSIVRSIMNAHHGSCGVTNTESGVEFWLSVKQLA